MHSNMICLKKLTSKYSEVRSLFELSFGRDKTSKYNAKLLRASSQLVNFIGVKGQIKHEKTRVFLFFFCFKRVETGLRRSQEKNCEESASYHLHWSCGLRSRKRLFGHYSRKSSQLLMHGRLKLLLHRRQQFLRASLHASARCRRRGERSTLQTSLLD